VQVPVLFGITDNGISISLRGFEWLRREYVKKLRMPVFVCDGQNLLDVVHETRKAAAYVRRHKKPATIVYSDVPRRFGHAATDRQIAYMSADEIGAVAGQDPLAKACAQVAEAGLFTYPQLLAMYDDIHARTRRAFAAAVQEPKIATREELVQTNSAPLVAVPSVIRDHPAGPKGHVMRKHMTRVIDETLARHPQAVYLGEDVVHGGYYLVTDGLADKYPTRVRDFPPEETALLGAGIGVCCASHARARPRTASWYMY
jgi:2-oxoisovalerate dehydrogenase E1 component